VSAVRPSDDEILPVLDAYLDALQGHVGADDMMPRLVTEDFETGFADGFRWRGHDGLVDFLAAREGFFDERHDVREVLAMSLASPDEVVLTTRLEFFLRRWEAPAPRSEEFTGTCIHDWIVRRAAPGEPWRVAAQIVDRFADLNDNAARLFATPAEGLND
jgi:hypothetical protein